MSIEFFEYILTVRHDKGKIRLKTTTTSYAKAIELVIIAEGCPERAIISIKKKQ